MQEANACAARGFEGTGRAETSCAPGGELTRGTRSMTDGDEPASGIAPASPRAHIAAMHNLPESERCRIKVMEAIARNRLLTARYNGQSLRLAPHALFARRGELFVSALNLAKNRRSPDDRRLGCFKLAGLADVEVGQEPFEALQGTAASLAQPGDEMILAAE